MTIFDPPVCPQCGAQRVRQRGECWLCGVDPVEHEQRGRVGSKRIGREFSFSLSSLLLVMTLVAICLGVLVEARGLGVFVCIALVPALVRTVRTVRERESLGERVSAVSKIGLLLGSFGLAVTLLVVAGVAAFSTLCGVCLTIVTVGSGSSEYLVPTVLLCALGAGAIVALIYARRRIRF